LHREFREVAAKVPQHFHMCACQFCTVIAVQQIERSTSIFSEWIAWKRFGNERQEFAAQNFQRTAQKLPLRPYNSTLDA